MQTNGFACSTPSMLSPIGYQAGDCGYCKSEGQDSGRTPNSRASYYVRSKSLCPNHYQDLMNRGWRRSGNLLYLPDASRSCCPHYTIRLPASELKPVRDHRQALHRWNRFVLGEKYAKEVARKHAKSKEEKNSQKTTFDLVASLHEAEVSHLKPGIEPDYKFEVSLEADAFTEEKFELFSAYQRHVHHEGDGDISKAGFRRFLCSTPLHHHEGSGIKTGSFHQTYRLDGRLIAIGVLDLMPHAVSGVYFIYHPDFEKYSFGKLSALREAALALEGGYEYYYMGYYIHSCKKMRYKGDYKTQQVLDYDTGNWDPLDEKMEALMDRRKWVSMSREASIAKIINTDPTITGEEGSSLEDDAVERLYAVKHPTPLEAFQSGLSVLELEVPGITKLDELQALVNLDEMKISIGEGETHRMKHIVLWDTGSFTDANTFKGVIVEYAACVGPMVAAEGVVDFRR